VLYNHKREPNAPEGRNALRQKGANQERRKDGTRAGGPGLQRMYGEERKEEKASGAMTGKNEQRRRVRAKESRARQARSRLGVRRGGLRYRSELECRHETEEQVTGGRGKAKGKEVTDQQRRGEGGRTRSVTTARGGGEGEALSEKERGNQKTQESSTGRVHGRQQNGKNRRKTKGGGQRGGQNEGTMCRDSDGEEKWAWSDNNGQEHTAKGTDGLRRGGGQRSVRMMMRKKVQKAESQAKDGNRAKHERISGRRKERKHATKKDPGKAGDGA